VWKYGSGGGGGLKRERGGREGGRDGGYVKERGKRLKARRY